MENLNSLVSEFGKQTLKMTEEAAKKLGVSINREFVDKSFALAWALATILQEEDGIDVEPIEPYIEIAKGLTLNERVIGFCFNICRGGFFQLEDGNFSGALETFGFTRMMIGYLTRDDIRKIFAKNGQKGGTAKHEPMNRVKARMIAMYRAGSWKSARQAAKRLEQAAKTAATEEGAKFTTDDVFARVYGWLLQADKNAMSAS